MAAIRICWIEDSSGTHSCHRNGGGSFRESYVGHLVFVTADRTWIAILSGSSDRGGPFRSFQVAQKFVEDSVGGRPVGDW
jgi:hypothetical protein